MSKISIELEYPLNDLKKAYRRFFSEPSNHKVSKEDVSRWIANLISADIENILMKGERH